MNKKFWKKTIVTLLSAAMMLSCVITSSAATVSPKKISIKSTVTSMTVGETLELDSKITPAKAKVKDSNIVWTSSNTSVIKVLEKNDDDTKIKAVGTGTATIKVKIKGSGISSSIKITVKNASADTSGTALYKSYKETIASYKKQLKEVYSSIKETTPATTLVELRKQIKDFEYQFETIEDKLDTLEDKIERKYKAGKLTGNQYRKLDAKIENAEDYADKAEKYLEYKFGDD
ncbi:MAG: Ig-like domain-containing protein [Clostridiales bacterium]|nr:Ig-like domain-containing protein [Clostridiales bacterium]